MISWSPSIITKPSCLILSEISNALEYSNRAILRSVFLATDETDLSVFLTSSREVSGGPYQPSIVLIAVTARFSYAAIVAMFFFSTSVKDASVKFGSALYQSKLEKYFWSQGSLKTLP